jgi:polysaccharide biosynthesis transport protein
MHRSADMTFRDEATVTPRRISSGGGGSTGVRESVDLSLFLRIVYRRRWLALLAFVAIVIPAVAWTMLQQPVYAAHVRIAIDPEPTAPLQFAKGSNDAPPADAVQTQREILESRELARRTIVRLKLFDTAEFRAPEATPIGRLLALLGLGAAPQSPAPVTATDDVRANLVVGGFQSRMKVVPLSFTRLIDVVFESSDPALAARAANGIADTFIVQDLDARLGSVKDATTWLGQRLEEERKRVETSESALQVYKEQQNALAVEDRQNIVVQKLSDLNTAVTKAKTERFLKETTYRQIEKAQSEPAQLETIPTIAANRAIQQLRAELATHTRQEAVLSQQYGELHPEMLKVRSAIETANDGIERETAKAVELAKNEYLGSLENERRLVSALEEQKSEALRLNRQDLEYGRLQREADANRRLYDALLQQTRQTGITGEFKQSSIRIVDRAEVPPRPIRPQRIKNAVLAVSMGLFAAIGLAFARDFLDARIKTPKDLQDALKLPFLGLLPAVSPLPTPLSSQVLAAQPQLGEAIRRVRTTLVLSNPTSACQVLLITSAAPGEGKSVITNLLGTAFASAHRRTIIIDTDLRRPRVHELVGCTPGPGLSDYLTGRAKLDEVLRSTSTDRLSVITAGSESDSPAELLGSAPMAKLLEDLAQSFDWILLDTSPVLAVADALIVARLCGGVLFVVAAEATSTRDVQRAESQLMLTNRPFAGCVLNRVPLEKHPYYYAPYHNAEYDGYYRAST